MVMNLVQQGEDLQDFSDEALANELQTGQRGYLPIAVISEIERRTRDRQRYQQTMAAQQAEAPPVVETRLMEFMAQAQPSPEMGMAPEMPPEMAGMPPQGIMAAQPEMAPMPAEAPAGIASMMPVQQAAEGGMVRRAQTGMTSTDPLGYLVGEGMTLTGQGIAGTGRFIAGAGLSQPGYSSLLSATAMTEAERLRRRILAKEQINLDASQERAALAALEQTSAPSAATPASGVFSLPAARGASIFSERRPGTDYSDGTQERRESPVLEGFTPRISNFQDVYNRELADRLLRGVTVQSQKVTPESVAAASEKAKSGFYAQEMERLKKFAPDRGKFDLSSEADLAVGLGAVIAGATQRGDIAKGLAQLAAQQREAQKEFRREEMQYEMGLAGLRKEQRAEERAEAAQLRAERSANEAIARAEEKAARGESAQIAARVQAGELSMLQLQLQQQQLNAQLLQARLEAQRATTEAERKQAMDIVNQLLANMKILKDATDIAASMGPKATLPPLVQKVLGESSGFTSAADVKRTGQ